MAQTRRDKGMQHTADLVRDLFGLDDEVPEVEEEDVQSNIPNFKIMYDKESGEQFFIGWNEDDQKMDIYPVSEELKKRKWSSTKPEAKTEMFDPKDYQQTAQQIFQDWNTSFEETPWSGGDGNIDPSERRRITESQKIIASMNDSSAPQYKLYHSERLTNLKETLEGKLNPNQQRRARQHLTSVNAYVSEIEELLSEGKHPVFIIDTRKKLPTNIKKEDANEDNFKSVNNKNEIDNPTYDMLIVNPIWSSMEQYQDIAKGLAQRYPLENLTESIDYLAGIGMPIDILLSAEHLRNSLDEAANMLLMQSSNK